MVVGWYVAFLFLFFLSSEWSPECFLFMFFNVVVTHCGQLFAALRCDLSAVEGADPSIINGKAQQYKHNTAYNSGLLFLTTFFFQLRLLRDGVHR